MVVPGLMLVTFPLLSIVATAGFELVHGAVASGIPAPVKVEFVPLHTLAIPLIAAPGLTITCTELSQEPELV